MNVKYSEPRILKSEDSFFSSWIVESPRKLHYALVANWMFQSLNFHEINSKPKVVFVHRRSTRLCVPFHRNFLLNAIYDSFELINRLFALLCLRFPRNNLLRKHPICIFWVLFCCEFFFSRMLPTLDCEICPRLLPPNIGNRRFGFQQSHLSEISLIYRLNQFECNADTSSLSQFVNEKCVPGSNNLLLLIRMNFGLPVIRIRGSLGWTRHQHFFCDMNYLDEIQSQPNVECRASREMNGKGNEEVKKNEINDLDHLSFCRSRLFGSARHNVRKDEWAALFSSFALFRSNSGKKN